MPKRTIGLLASWIATSVLLLVHSLRFNFITDDAYISFVYARNLSENGELVFNLGDRVEGVTNFLWTVALATAHFVGFNIETASLVLAFTFAALTIRSCMTMFEDFSCQLAIALILASSASFACWTSGGLETMMFAYVVVLSFLRFHNHGNDRWVVALCLIATLVRPEGSLLFLCLWGASVLDALTSVKGPSLRALKSLLLYLVLFSILIACRKLYFGEWLPNTFFVKAGQSTELYSRQLSDQGAFYLNQWCEKSFLYYLAPFFALGIVSQVKRSGLAALLLVVAYCFYSIRVGGDFMGLHRFMMPATILIFVYSVFGMKALLSLVKWHPATVVIAPLIFGVSQYSISAEAAKQKSADSGIDAPGYLKEYADDRAAVGKAMEGCFEPEHFSIFGGVGAQPFFSRAQGVDVFGLVSKEVAHKLKPTRPRPGHNKWAPPQFLMDHYDPDFVFHCYRIHRAPIKGRLCGEEGVWNRAGYVRDSVAVSGLSHGNTQYTFLRKKSVEMKCR